MRRPCKVGKDRRRAKIEAAVREGMTYDRALELYGFARNTLNFHMLKRCGCFDPSTATEAPTERQSASGAPIDGEILDVDKVVLDTPEAVLSTATRLMQRAERLMARAEANDDVRGAITAFAALMKPLETLYARVHGLIDDAPKIDQSQRTLNLVLAGMTEDELRAFLRGEPSSKALQAGAGIEG